MGNINFLLLSVIVLIGGIGYCSCEGGKNMESVGSHATIGTENEQYFDASEWNEEEVTVDELLEWRLLGAGSATKAMGEQLFLEETDQSQGVMLLSPTYYQGDIVVRYKALALSPASVFVTVLSATDISSNHLTIPENYDGTMGFWTTGANNYFFAFKNAPHGGTPFIAKNPHAEQSANAPEQDLMVAGVYYDIEIGRAGNNLWLLINGRKVIDMVDETPITNGHVAFRLRGTAGLKAIGLIKDLAIYTKS